MTFSRIISDLKILNSCISKINHPPPSAMSTLYNYTAAVEGGGGTCCPYLCAHPTENNVARYNKNWLNLSVYFPV